MFGKKGDLHPMYGKSLSAETRVLIKKVQGTDIFIFSLDDSLMNSFCSAKEAGLFFNCFHTTNLRYVKNVKLFEGIWILSISPIRPAPKGAGQPEADLLVIFLLGNKDYMLLNLEKY